MISDRKTTGFALRILCAMLLVFLGFAHKPFEAAAAQEMVLASYVLPDGTTASLCLPDQDGKQGKHVDRGCEACRIGSNIVLPVPSADTKPATLGVTTVASALAPEAFHRLVFPPNAPPRGPPAVSFSFATA